MGRARKDDARRTAVPPQREVVRTGWGEAPRTARSKALRGLSPARESRPAKGFAVYRANSRREALVWRLREAKASAQRAENLFRETFEQAAVGIAHVAPDGRFLRVNDRFCQIVGYDHDEVLARTFQDITHPADVQEDLEFVRRMLSGEIGTYSMDKRYLRKGGGVAWVNLTVALVRAESGAPEYFISVVQDIGARRNMQSALEQRTGELRERVKELVCLYQVSQVAASDQLELHEKLRRITDLIPPGFQYPEVTTAAIRLEDRTFSSEGFERTPRALCSPIRDARRTIGEICVVYREERPPAGKGPFLPEEQDLLDEIARQIGLLRHRVFAQRELREAKERAEETSRLKSMFLANVSHELRTPMNSILGYTALVLDGVEGPLRHEQEESLRKVERNAGQLLHLINQLLDFSRIEAGKVTLEREPFSLRETLRQTVKTLELMAERKGLVLSCAVSPDCPDILVGDAPRLEEILLNLGSNALKFTREGSVSLAAVVESRSPSSVRLHLRVEDTGIGIPSERQKAIFDAFEQVLPVGRETHEGLGLGLAICSDLVGLLGGRIWVESEVGRGSTFHFTAEFGTREEGQAGEGPGEASRGTANGATASREKTVSR